MISCGGRTALFDVYAQREFIADKPCVFLADRDMYVFDGIPQQYDEIIFTTGYSIENDILYDSKVEDAFSDRDLVKFDHMKKELSKWWAIELCIYTRQPELANIDQKICTIFQNIDDSAPNIDMKNYTDKVLSSLKDIGPLCKTIYNDFELKMRGHNLHQLYQYFLVKGENQELKGTSRCLLHTCIHFRKPPLFQKLIDKIQKAFLA